MNGLHHKGILVGMVLGILQVACTGPQLHFTPLTQSAPVVSPNHADEINAPWQVPAGVTYRNLTSLREIEADSAQSTVRVPGQGHYASVFDMAAFDSSGKYVFIPHETRFGAGVTRYNLEKDFAEVLLHGDGSGNWTSDYGSFDPATWTPNNTLLLAEEWSGEGRVIEILNPLAPVNEIRYRELNSIPNVAHEGLRFSQDGKTLYFIDEWKSGSIYKFIPTQAGDYTQGQAFVLVVDAYRGIPAESFDSPANRTVVRTGNATWVPITDTNGKALTKTDPFLNGPSLEPDEFDARGGRGAADEVNGTPYGRPEDIEVGRLRNGNAVLYFTATSEQAVYSVEELGNGKALVRLMASQSITPKNLGYAPTTATLNSPDNLAQDANGNLYIIEDAPNDSSIGGDIWYVRDVDGDGVAESLDHFMSLRVSGAEASGMIFHPQIPTQFVITVQHPTSTDLSRVTNGRGDALWLFELRDMKPAR